QAQAHRQFEQALRGIELGQPYRACVASPADWYDEASAEGWANFETSATEAGDHNNDASAQGGVAWRMQGDELPPEDPVEEPPEPADDDPRFEDDVLDGRPGIRKHLALQNRLAAMRRAYLLRRQAIARQLAAQRQDPNRNRPSTSNGIK